MQRDIQFICIKISVSQIQEYDDKQWVKRENLTHKKTEQKKTDQQGKRLHLLEIACVFGEMKKKDRNNNNNENKN